MNFTQLTNLDQDAKSIIIEGVVFPFNSWILEKGSNDTVVIYGSPENSSEIITFEYTLESLKSAELIGNRVYLKNSAGKDTSITFKK